MYNMYNKFPFSTIKEDSIYSINDIKEIYLTFLNLWENGCFIYLLFIIRVILLLLLKTIYKYFLDKI